MQVVYSGGSTTPSPSPRLQRKQYGYGRPVLPGYVLGPPPQCAVHRSPTKEKVTTPSENDSNLRDSIPILNKPMAITCLVCNICIPGLGTFISGLSVVCCAQKCPKDCSVRKVLMVNSWVALLQFVTAFLFLLGWIWSIVWGASFITLSDKFYKKTTHEKESDKKAPDKLKTDEINRKIEDSPNIDNKGNRNKNNEDSVPLEANEPVPPFTTSYTNTCLPGSASDSQLHQPMIVLQELPVIHQSESVISPYRPIMNARTRHQKILRRQMSDNELSPFSLTQEQLEEIVIHAAPIPRGRSEEGASGSDPVVHSTLITVAEK